MVVYKCKWKHTLHLKADSRAQNPSWPRNPMLCLQVTNSFNTLDESEWQLKGYGANANIYYLGSCKFYLWRGQRPYTFTFQILLEKDDPTLLSGADCLQLGLIKWLGSVNTTRDNSKKEVYKYHTKNSPITIMRSSHHWFRRKHIIQTWLMNKQSEHFQERSITSK